MQTRTKARAPKAQLAFKLLNAPKADVVAEHATLWDDPFADPVQVVAKNLTYQQAVRYLSLVYNRLNHARGGTIRAAFLIPWVTAWLNEVPGEAQGFIVSLWMVGSENEGLWDIVDMSLPYYRLPWLGGMGWALWPPILG